MSARSKKLRLIFEWFEKQGLSYVLVGEETKKIAYDVPGDTDIVISRQAMLEMDSFLEKLQKDCDVRLIQVFQHEISVLDAVVTWFEDGCWQFLWLDMCSDYVRDARKFLTAEEVLEGRRQDSSTGYYVPTPEKNFLYYLVKKIDKRGIDENQFAYLRECLSSCNEQERVLLRKDLARFWSNQSRNTILQFMECNEYENFARALSKLRCDLRKHIHLNPLDVLPDFFRIIRYIRHPLGFIVEVYSILRDSHRCRNLLVNYALI